ncbi:unnamed protein product [Allacma fusca]|uniref:Uncharacterized protein n=1 Tax=Allacma fusca TaxID=39272 RepID=A0A8J2PS66_9HEXA|nr:unnamed protein product [Allacma fusca]
MYAKMEEASRAKEATTKTVAEMMELAKAVVQDRESLEASLEEQKNLNMKMMNIRSQESELVRELRDKIKVMEEAHKLEVQKLLQKIRELEKILDGIGEMHQKDISQLKELLQEKSQRIEMLRAEKSQLALDLETVWRATTSSAGKK